MHFVCGVMTFLPVSTGFCTFVPVYTVVMCETVFTWYKPNPDTNNTERTRFLLEDLGLSVLFSGTKLDKLLPSSSINDVVALNL